MYKCYLCKSITLNCIKFSLLTNWVIGNFNYSSIQAHNSGILQICLYGDYLATAGADRTCKLYDINSGMCLKVYKGHEKCVLCVKMDEKKVKTYDIIKNIYDYIHTYIYKQLIITFFFYKNDKNKKKKKEKIYF